MKPHPSLFGDTGQPSDSLIQTPPLISEQSWPLEIKMLTDDQQMVFFPKDDPDYSNHNQKSGPFIKGDTLFCGRIPGKYNPEKNGLEMNPNDVKKKFEKFLKTEFSKSNVAFIAHQHDSPFCDVKILSQILVSLSSKEKFLVFFEGGPFQKLHSNHISLDTDKNGNISPALLMSSLVHTFFQFHAEDVDKKFTYHLNQLKQLIKEFEPDIQDNIMDLLRFPKSKKLYKNIQNINVNDPNIPEFVKKLMHQKEDIIVLTAELIDIVVKNYNKDIPRKYLEQYLNPVLAKPNPNTYKEFQTGFMIEYRNDLWEGTIERESKEKKNILIICGNAHISDLRDRLKDDLYPKHKQRKKEL